MPNGIRVIRAGKLGAKTNGGMYWTIMRSGLAIGEIHAPDKKISFPKPVIFTEEEFGQLSQLLNDCIEYHQNKNRGQG